jgi:hypothetical protein
MLFASNDQILDKIIIDCHLPSMDDNDSPHRDEDDGFQPTRPMGLVSD